MQQHKWNELSENTKNLISKSNSGVSTHQDLNEDWWDVISAGADWTRRNFLGIPDGPGDIPTGPGGGIRGNGIRGGSGVNVGDASTYTGPPVILHWPGPNTSLTDLTTGSPSYWHGTLGDWSKQFRQFIDNIESMLDGLDIIPGTPGSSQFYQLMRDFARYITNPNQINLDRLNGFFDTMYGNMGWSFVAVTDPTTGIRVMRLEFNPSDELLNGMSLDEWIDNWEANATDMQQAFMEAMEWMESFLEFANVPAEGWS